MTIQFYFLRQLITSSILLLSVTISVGQKTPCKEIENDLVQAYSKIFPFYYGNYDSLEFYSNHFSKKISDYINENPTTLYYPFKTLADSACGIVTSSDGLFRIYSWDTWLGGTMHDYKNIFQFKSAGKVYTTNLGDEENDFGTLFTDVYILKANAKKYYLAVSGGSESTKDAYETISVYSIEKDSLNNTLALIKTPSGLNNSISFEYDFLSVAGRPERPIRLIKYDEVKKIIYVPVVLENGKVTDRFILYQFNGQYFEHIKTEKEKIKKK